MSPRLIWRKSLNVTMLSLTGLCALITVAALFFILGYLVWNGGKDLSWNFFTRLPVPVGEVGGGMANAIVGSLKLLLLAALFGVLVVMPMHHFSTLAGGFALGIMVIPTVLRNTESFLRDVPLSLREGAFALGANKWRMVATVVLPAASRGILTGALLALARVAGETAPLLFTAFGNRYWSPGWMQPTSSLPVVIYTYATGPYEDWHQQAWAAGLVLLGLVLLTNIVVRAFLSRGTSFERS